MDNLAKEYVVSFFERSLMMHGDRPEAVRWTASGQEAHYRALLDIGELAGAKILDYGCGTGGLYGFLRERRIPVDYTGFDINPKLIAQARTKYPDARFEVFDVEEQDLAEEFDYILLCGVFNLKVHGLEETVRIVLKKLFSLCRKGLAFNALSEHNPKKEYELNYLKPEEMIAFAAEELSCHVALRLDRIPHDFFLFVYRTPQNFMEERLPA
ncbi:MAG TPA: class I SAM-dependent methyltransferase [Dissulfurispiraceae bacterium]|nr:class I SAM-dependent methyltransferase [Dissulfurispiraceae bacterium]